MGNKVRAHHKKQGSQRGGVHDIHAEWKRIRPHAIRASRRRRAHGIGIGPRWIHEVEATS
ncbi:hypothetical protein ACWEQ8_17545 [Streptomyces noursei]|uniref:hypothetical protein n=1 Tax=Streptomyces noursei TaxID=1971 RepID=UPI0035D86DE0